MRYKFKFNGWTVQIYLIVFSLMVISDYYYKVLQTEAERLAFRDIVLKRTGVAYTTFYYKMKNDTWSQAEIEVINNIIKEGNNA